MKKKLNQNQNHAALNSISPMSDAELGKLINLIVSWRNEQWKGIYGQEPSICRQVVWQGEGANCTARVLTIQIGDKSCFWHS